MAMATIMVISMWRSAPAGTTITTTLTLGKGVTTRCTSALATSKAFLPLLSDEVGRAGACVLAVFVWPIAIS